jgi:hypothetical protein
MIGSIIRSMVIEMNESRLTSIEQLRAFLDGIALGRRYALAHDEARVLVHDDGLDLGAAQIDADARRYGSNERREKQAKVGEGQQSGATSRPSGNPRPGRRPTASSSFELASNSSTKTLSNSISSSRMTTAMSSRSS